MIYAIVMLLSGTAPQTQDFEPSAPVERSEEAPVAQADSVPGPAAADDDDQDGFADDTDSDPYAADEPSEDASDDDSEASDPWAQSADDQSAEDDEESEASDGIFVQTGTQSDVPAAEQTSNAEAGNVGKIAFGGIVIFLFAGLVWLYRRA